MKLPGPQVGEWYMDVQSGATFEVVALDAQNQLVETQHIDGEISEYDIESWRQLRLVAVAEPDDWRNPFEMDGEENNDPDLPFHPEDWSGPLNDIEPQFMRGVEDS